MVAICAHIQSLLPLASVLLPIVVEVILAHFAFLNDRAALLHAIVSPTKMTQRLRRRSGSLKSPDRSLRLTEHPYNVAEQIVYKIRGNGREGKPAKIEPNNFCCNFPFLK